ncbi:MAG: type II toxin-antitoxin system death-on-curing family toxin [Deltaproteobacteria bacterium]|nr:type II toxin-antitoxin system death-on-curing family toxin [Deltaproteobacteria bacterium]
MRELTIDHVEYIAHNMAKIMMEWDEPIPDFLTRFPGRLESCLKTPLQSFGNKDLYPKLEDKAAILFYLMVKNHPFQNGNKRIAVTALLTFLYINSRWLSIQEDELYELAVDVAKSRPVMKAGLLIIIRDVLKKYMMKR